MEVILKEDIKNLGLIGDIVSVKPGYGRNFLVPQGKAVFVTADNLKQLELQKEELRKKQDEELSVLREKAQTFEGLKLTIEANVTDEGTLYGSIGVIDIANSAIEKGIEIEKSFINMPDGPIKKIGSHEVELLLHPEIRVMITVEVIGGEVAIKNTLDSEEEEDNINEENIIKSPMVGVAYLSVDPNSPPYVKIGQHVKIGDTLLLIEAMKTFNEIKAPKSGVIKKIVTLNSQPVEYGDHLIIFE